MKTLNKVLTVLMVTILFTLAGCEKDAENPISPNSGTGNPCNGENNTFDCASAIQVGVPVYDKIESQGDKDYFTFTTSQPGVIKIAIEDVPPNIDIDVYVYDSHQNQITASTGTANGQSAFFYLLRNSEKHYILIQGGYYSGTSESNYKVTVNNDISDVYEINNNFSTSKNISLNSDVKGKIMPTGDVDYYKFALNTAGVLEISLDPAPPEIDMDVYLYDEQQNQITYSSGTANGQAVYMFVLVKAGTYYIRLQGGYYSGQSNSFYTLRLNLDVSDIYEVNNTFSEAKTIELLTDINAKIRPSGDWDYFKFTVTNPGMHQISVNPVPSAFGMDVYIYDQQQSQVAYSTGTGNGQAVYMNVNLNAGIYYVRLGEYWGGNSTEFYTLKVVR